MSGMLRDGPAIKRMPEGERAYYEARAEAEIDAAHRAGHPAAARAHYLLAAFYLDLAHNPAPGCGVAIIPARAPAATRIAGMPDKAADSAPPG